MRVSGPWRFGWHLVVVARFVHRNEPIPKRRTEIETIMVVLGPDQHVRVDKLSHQ